MDKGLSTAIIAVIILVVVGIVALYLQSAKIEEKPLAKESEPMTAEGKNPTHAESAKQESSSKTIAPESKIIKTPGYAELIDVSDGLAGLISGDRITQVIDVTDKESPRLEVTIDTPGFAETVYTSAEYLYVGDSREFRILPSKDVLGKPIGVYDLGNFRPSAMTVDGDYVYLVSGNQLLILSIKDLNNPVKVSQTAITGNAPTEVYIQDGYAYIIATLGGLNIVDISNPQNPVITKVIPFESHTVGFRIMGNYAYLGRIVSIEQSASETGYATKSVFEVIDISSPASAKIMHSVEISTDIRALDVSGNHVYVIGSYPHRFTVIDISSPTSPRILDVKEIIVGSADLQDISVSDGYAFIADGSQGLRIVDVRDPSNTIYVKDLDLEGRAFNIVQSKNKLYVNVEQKYFNVVDARNTKSPVLAFSERYTSSYPTASIVLKDRRAYFKADEFKVYDLTDPSKPKKMNQESASVDSVQVQGNYLYSTIGEIGLLVYDITDISRPTLVSKTPFPVGIPRDLSVDGKWAVGISNIPYSINVLDISNPKSPVAKDSYKYEKYPFSVEVKDGYAYVARGEDGVDVVRINSDGSLELVGNLQSKGYAQSVTVSGNEAFIVRDGIEIFDVSDPSSPAYVSKLNTDGEATRVAVDSGYVYVAGGFSGMIIIPLPL